MAQERRGFGVAGSSDVNSEAEGRFAMRVMPSTERPPVWLWDALLLYGGSDDQPTHGAKSGVDFGEAATREEAIAAAERALEAMRAARRNAR